VKRAPRLPPDQRIAGYVTRVGRFSKVDPRKGTQLPAVHVLAARLGWAVVVGVSFRRAVGAARAARADLEASGT